MGCRATPVIEGIFLTQGSSPCLLQLPHCRWFLYPWTTGETHSLFCCCSVTQLCLTLCDPTDCSAPGLPVSHRLPELSQVHVHCITDAIQPSLILWHPLPHLPSIFPSIRDFSNELSIHIRWPKYWSFSFSISLSSKYSRLISLKVDWFDLAVHRTFRSLLQHHSSKASILRLSAFFMVQLSQPHMTTRKTIASTMWTFVGRVTSLLFNTLSRFVMAFLPRSSHLLISWLQSPSTVILEPKKRKSVTTSTFSLYICHAEMGPGAMTLVFFNI